MDPGYGGAIFGRTLMGIPHDVHIVDAVQELILGIINCIMAQYVT